jgi:nicotinamide mononucleotide transporter
MQALLHAFYMAMAVYGWYHWSNSKDSGRSLPVVSWPLAFHFLPLLSIAALTALSGYLLSKYSNAALPYIDSFTTWSAIFATWLVARKVLQNWHYWLVIDSVSVFIYASKAMWFTVLLYLAYLVLVVFGLRAWRATETA